MQLKQHYQEINDLGRTFFGRVERTQHGGKPFQQTLPWLILRPMTEEKTVDELDFGIAFRI